LSAKSFMGKKKKTPPHLQVPLKPEQVDP
jgi:hypothetical protein